MSEHLRLAREQLNRINPAELGGGTRQFWLHVLDHLEQTAVPPEAAPERATRYEADRQQRAYVAAQELVESTKMWQPITTANPATVTAVPLASPSAVQGEERTWFGGRESYAEKGGAARFYVQHGRLGLRLWPDVGRDEEDSRSKAIAAEAYLNSLASSSPTATAQRGEACAWCRKSREEHGEAVNWIGHVFQEPAPLPAQTEPGEREKHRILWPDGGFWTGPGHFVDGVMYAYCETCKRVVWVGPQPAPTPPSPAPECAHDWRDQQAHIGAGEYCNTGFKLCPKCRAALWQGKVYILAPSLPTEGEAK